MLELLLCSMLTILPDYLYRRYVQGKRFGRDITLMWYVGPPMAVARDELHVHRAGLVRQNHRARDLTFAEIPEPERAPQLDVARERV